MKCFVPLMICLGISSAWPVKENVDDLEDPSWKAWKSFHNKNYVDEGEERLRNFIWQDNLKRIVSHNEVHKYKLAMNHLGDMVRFKSGTGIHVIINAISLHNSKCLKVYSQVHEHCQKDKTCTSS